jgi:ABC-type multidrug transport system fused ATPase/permease subunit
LPNLTYQVRRSVAANTEEYTLTDTTLLWSGGSVPFAHIKSIRIYSTPGMWMLGAGKVAAETRYCAITLDSGASIQLSNQHFLSFGNFEDRSPAFFQFLSALAARVRTENPAAQIVSGMPPMLWWSWFLTFSLLVFVIILCIVLGLLGLSLQHQNSLGTSLVFLALAAMLFGPISFLRATWRRRTRVLNSVDISKDISKAV